jgi:hypothetical protein
MQRLAGMLTGAVYDLMVAPPHVADDARYTADEFRTYRAGYDWALVMALKTMQAAQERFYLFERTKRLDARRRK